MSLVAFGARIALQRALAGKTLAADRIYDSLVTPIDQTIIDPRFAKGGLPIITVATDDDQTTYQSGADLTPHSRELDIVVEWALATVTVVGDIQTIEIPHTDAGIEAALNFMHRQIMRALADRSDPWADLFWIFAGNVRRGLIRRGADSEKGVRYGARQMILTVDPMFEPGFGVAPEPDLAFGRLLTLMGADLELNDLGQVLSEMIVGLPLTDWPRIAAALGIGGQDQGDLGLTPVVAGENGTVPIEFVDPAAP